LHGLGSGRASLLEHQSEIERVDRVEPEAFAEQRRLEGLSSSHAPTFSRSVLPVPQSVAVPQALVPRPRPDTEIVVTERAAGILVEAHLEAGGEPAAHATLRLA